MAPKKSTPFFAELGKMLNSIRSISAELNEEMSTDQNKKAALYNIWYARDSAIAKLQANLQQLESEIAYFFTGNGFKKTIDDRLNTQQFRQKFAETFKKLTSEYLNIKSDSQEKDSMQQNDIHTASGPQISRPLPFSLLN
ncbi:MAG: hypothetical protein QM791_00580 [Ferruginibacter sp.]